MEDTPRCRAPADDACAAARGFDRCRVADRPAHRVHGRRPGELACGGNRPRADDGEADAGRRVGTAGSTSRGCRCVAVGARRARSPNCANAHRRFAADVIWRATANVAVRASRRRARDHAAVDLRHGPVPRARDARRAAARGGRVRRRPAVGASPARRAPARRRLFMDAVLRRQGEEMLLDEPSMLHAEGLLLARGSFARFDHGGAFGLWRSFESGSSVRVPENELPALLASLYALPRRPALELPPDTHVTEVRTPPQPGVTILPDPHSVAQDASSARAVLSLRQRCASPATRPMRRCSIATRSPCIIATSRGSARRARGSLALGAREEWNSGDSGEALTIHANKLTRAHPRSRRRGLACRSRGRGVSNRRPDARDGALGHRLVRARRRRAIRRHRGVAAAICSPRDARGATTIVLLRRQPRRAPARMARAPRPARGRRQARRRRRCAIGARRRRCSTRCSTRCPKPTSTRPSRRRATELRTFDRVAPVDPPPTFRGTLREYQREGLGWLHFLRTLRARRLPRRRHGARQDGAGARAARRASRARRPKPTRPSIVVVPRSLVFNWMREAERFAPQLRVLDYTGSDRRDRGRSIRRRRRRASRPTARCAATRRRSPAIQFDYAILDEAQAIKNAGTASAKAARCCARTIASR